MSPVVRKRRRSGTGSDISREENEDKNSTISPTKKKRRTGGGNGSSLGDVIQEVYDILRTHRSEDGQRVLCETFMRVPTRRSCPEYYEIIKQPIDFITIQKNIKMSKYEKFEQFGNDVQLLIDNAKMFYKRISQEYKDANELWSLFQESKNEINDEQLYVEPCHNLFQQVASMTPYTEEMIEDSIGLAKNQNLLPNELKILCQNILLWILQYTESDDGGRHIAEIFKRLPDQHQYPDYYQFIAEPIDLWIISRRIEQGRYTTLAELEKDFNLLISNAKRYNEPGSQVSKDANLLKKYFQQCLSMKFETASLESGSHLQEQITKHFEDYLTSSGSEDDEDDRTNPATLPDTSLDMPKLSPSDLGVVHSSESAQFPSMHENASFPEYQAACCYFDTSDCEPDVEDEETGVGISPYWALYLSCVTAKDDNGNRLCKIFKKLPSKRAYPEYFQNIKRTMTISKIKGKIKKARYKSLDHCFEDFVILFENCLKFNKPDTNAHQIAKYLFDVVKKKKLEIEEKGVDNEEYVPMRKKPGRKPGTKIIPLGPDGAPCPELKEDLDMLRKRLRFLFNVITKHTESGGRVTSEMFMNLPSKEEYPDYYHVIQYPLDLKVIDKKIRCNEYTCEEQFISDIELMFNNAKLFNEEGSQIYHDACKLEKAVKDKRAKLNPLRDDVDERICSTPCPTGRTKSAPGSRRKTRRFLGEFPSAKRRATYGMKSVRPMSPSPTSNTNSPNALNHSTVSNSSVGSTSASTSMTPVSRNPSMNVDQISFSNPMQKKLFTLYEAVKMVRDSRGRFLYEPFMKLPNRTELPDYYKVIKNPIDMMKINQKKNSNGYSDLNELVEDFSIMFDNAARFNEPTSRIYKDSVLLMRVLLEKKAELVRDDITDKVPNVEEAVLAMWQRILLFTINREDEDGRCYCDSLYPLLLNFDDQPPLSLNIISKNMDCSVYKRFDHFQNDLFTLLSYAHKISPADSEMFSDATDLKLFFIKKRDEMFRNGELFFTPALSVTARHIEKEVDEAKKSKAEVVHDDSKFDGEPATSASYKTNQFVYFTSSNNDVRNIFYIEQILKNSQGQIILVGRDFFHPNQIDHFKGRKFMNKEVFASFKNGYILESCVVGRCYVLHIKDYTRYTIEGAAEEDTYICESSYDPNAQVIRKLKVWDFAIAEQLNKREFRINRIDRKPLPDEAHVTYEDVPETYDSSLYIQNKQNVPIDDPESSFTFFEQVIHNGVCYRLGDGAVMSCEDPMPASHEDSVDSFAIGKSVQIRRIEKLWCAEGTMWFSGQWFLPPKECIHEPTKMFYQREVILSLLNENVISKLDDIVCKCAILGLKEFVAYRPTELPESQIFLCENVYQHEEKYLRKLRNLKMPPVSKQILEDELYFFKKTLVPVKIASPFLFTCNIDENDDEEEECNSVNYDDDAETPKNFKVNKVRTVKRPSGYILYAGHMRSKLKEQDPTSNFGELSRQVGKMWNELSQTEKGEWDKKAAEIEVKEVEPRAAQPCAGYENVQPFVVYECLWAGCDFQFEDEQDLFRHLIKEEHIHLTTSLQDNGQYKCFWATCTKNKKSSKIYPNINRLSRHIRDSHLRYAARYAYPPQLSRNYIAKGTYNQIIATSSTAGKCSWVQNDVVAGLVPSPQPFSTLAPNPPHSIGRLYNPNTDTPQQPGITVPRAQHAATQIASNTNSTVGNSYVAANSPQPVASPASYPPPGTSPVPTQVPITVSLAPSASVRQAMSMRETPHNPYPQGGFPHQVFNQVTSTIPRQPRNVYNSDGSKVFIDPPLKRTKLTHTEIYLKYIDGLRAESRHVSDFKATLRAKKENYPLPSEVITKLGKQYLPNGNGSFESTHSALWALRDYLLRDSVKIAHQYDIDDFVDPNEMNGPPSDAMEVGDVEEGRVLSAESL